MRAARGGHGEGERVPRDGSVISLTNDDTAMLGTQLSVLLIPDGVLFALFDGFRIASLENGPRGGWASPNRIATKSMPTLGPFSFLQCDGRAPVFSRIALARP